MREEIYKTEQWELFDENGHGVEITAEIAEIPGDIPVTRLVRGVTSDGKRVTFMALENYYIVEDGAILKASP